MLLNTRLQANITHCVYHERSTIEWRYMITYLRLEHRNFFRVGAWLDLVGLESHFRADASCQTR